MRCSRQVKPAAYFPSCACCTAAAGGACAGGLVCAVAVRGAAAARRVWHAGRVPRRPGAGAGKGASRAGAGGWAGCRLRRAWLAGASMFLPSGLQGRAGVRFARPWAGPSSRHLAAAAPPLQGTPFDCPVCRVAVQMFVARLQVHAAACLHLGCASSEPLRCQPLCDGSCTLLPLARTCKAAMQPVACPAVAHGEEGAGAAGSASAPAHPSAPRAPWFVLLSSLLALLSCLRRTRRLGRSWRPSCAGPAPPATCRPCARWGAAPPSVAGGGHSSDPGAACGGQLRLGSTPPWRGWDRSIRLALPRAAAPHLSHPYPPPSAGRL